MAQFQFDANTVAPNTGTQDPVPAGWYVAVIENSEMKPAKTSPDAMYIELRFNIVEGQYAGRKAYARLNIKNANQQAQEIAYRDLSAICHATGVIQMQQTEQLHNIPMKIKLSLRAASGDYEASNELKAYKHISENVGTASTGAAAQAPIQQMPAQQSFTPPPGGQPWNQQQVQQPVQQQQFQQPAQQFQQPVQQQQFAPQQQQFQQQPVQQQMQQPPVNQAQTQQQWAQQQVQQPVQQQQVPVQQQQQQVMQQQAPAQQQMQQQAPAGGAVPPWLQGQQ